MEALAHLEGAYAILVKSRHYPGELVGAKRGSPLILGVKSPGQPSSTRLSSPRGLGQGRDAIECFLASDASAVVEVSLWQLQSPARVCDKKIKIKKIQAPLVSLFAKSMFHSA